MKYTSIPGKTHRLIPTKYPPIQTFEAIASPEDFENLMELEGWTNDRLVAHRLKRLPEEQWVYGTCNASIIMASFLHAPPGGLRFNSGDLGAWYCSLDTKTAIAEVAHHLKREAIHCGWREMRVAYRCYHAKLLGNFCDIRHQQTTYPQFYYNDNWVESQQFGEGLRAEGKDGIAYSSIRYIGGENIVAYKPKQITQVIIGETYDIQVPVDGKVVARRVIAREKAA